MGIEGKVIAITGASGGIGEATAVMLAERGARVVLGARRLNRLEAISSRIEGAGGQVAVVEMDVKRRSDVLRLVTSACQRFGD